MRVFIDTVIYRKLFEGNPSKEYFDSLYELVKDQNFKLIFPSITRNEIYRGVVEILKEEPEEPKLIFHSKVFTNGKTKAKFEEMETLYKKEWETEYKKLLKENGEVKKEMSKKLFKHLFKLTLDYPDTEELLRLANNRKNKRYPPGKNNDPLGDQLVWEMVLKNCIDDDLIIVSDDGDWQDLTEKDEPKIHPYLQEEWDRKSIGKKIELVKNIGELIKIFKKEYKKPKEEIEKEEKGPMGNQGFPYTFPVTFGGITPSASASLPIGYATMSPSPFASASPSASYVGAASLVSLSGINTEHWCSRCGAYISSTANFCSQCGVKAR